RHPSDPSWTPARPSADGRHHRRLCGAKLLDRARARRGVHLWCGVVGFATLTPAAGVRGSVAGSGGRRLGGDRGSRPPRDSSGVDSRRHRRGGHRALRAVERRRRAWTGLRTHRARQGCATTACLLSARARRGVAGVDRVVRAFPARTRRRLDLRRSGVRLAGDGAVDGQRDQRARLSAGHGRGGAVRHAGAVRESRRRPRAAARRSTPARMIAARTWRRLGGTDRAATLLLTALVAAVIVVPLASHQNPIDIGDVLALRLLPPFARDPHGDFHLFGTDRFGRDLFVRMMLAGRVSLAVGIVGSLMASAVGTIVSAVAAWSGGVVDRVLMALADALLAIPRLVLLLVCAALWQPGLATVVVVLIATGWMGVSRLVRAELLGVRALPYVDAATAMGASPQRVLWRHALPNALGPAI